MISMILWSCDFFALNAHFWLKLNLALVVTPIRATTQPAGTQPLPMCKVILSRIQNSALLIIEFGQISVNPNFQVSRGVSEV